VQRAELNARAAFWMKIILAVFSASAIAAQFWSAAGSNTPWSLANVIGVCLAGIIGLISLYLAAFERDSSAVVEDARKALILAEDAEANHLAALRALDGFDIDQRRMIELYNAILRMRDLVEAFLAKPTDLETALRALIAGAQRPLATALGFQLDEHYTICIYVVEKSDDWHGRFLRLVAHARTIDCPIERARKWPLGVGVGGAALARGTDVVVPDLSSIEIGTLYTERQSKEGDEDRYRSMAAVPILLSEKDAPWGVVIGTSDRPGHFGTQPGVSNVEAIRVVAGMVALVVRAHRAFAEAPSATPAAAAAPASH